MKKVDTGRFFAYVGAAGGFGLSLWANVRDAYIPEIPQNVDPVLWREGYPGFLPVEPTNIDLAISGFFPMALFVALELLTRVQWQNSRSHKAIKWLGVGLPALVAGIISYSHLKTAMLLGGTPEHLASIGPLAVDGFMLLCSVVLLMTGRHSQSVDHTQSTTVVHSGPDHVDHVDHSVDQSVDHVVDHPVQAPWTTPVHPVRTTPVQSVDHSVDQSVDQPWSAGQSPVQRVDHSVDHSAGPAVDRVDQTAWTTVDQSVDRTVDHGGPAVDQTAVDRVDRTVDRVDQAAVDHVVQWTDLTDKEKADRTTKAVQEVLDGKSINGAAKANGVPKSTLIRKVKDAQTPVVVTDAKPELKAIEAAGIDLDAELAELLSNDKTKEA